jgi:hypothetical protein
MGRERVRDPLCTASRNRPADGVRGRAEHQPEGRGRRVVEGQHPVRGDAGEQPAGLCAGEPAARETLSRSQGLQPEARHRQRVPWPAQRREDRGEHARPVAHDRSDQTVVASGIHTKRGRRLGNRPAHDRRRSLVERVGQRHRWIDPLKPVAGEGQRPEKGDAMANGCTAEHVSCTKPGSVSSADRAPPPMVGCAS